jgi:hypothetical protein
LVEAHRRSAERIKARVAKKRANGDTVYSSDEEVGGEWEAEAAEELFHDEEGGGSLLLPPVPAMTNPLVREGGREKGREGGR